jgi:uncharacterized membrane protein YbhN (UPF0104 family)
MIGRDAVDLPPARDMNWVALLLVLPSTWLHLHLVSLRWRIVVNRSLGGQGFQTLYYPYTVLVGLLSFLVPTYAATVFVRAFALRHHLGATLFRGSALALYEQLVDALVPILFVVPALLVLFSELHGRAAALPVGVLGVLVALVAIRLLAAVGTRGRATRCETSEAGTLTTGEQSPSTRLGRDTLFRLVALSFVRHLNMLARFWLVGTALGTNISLPELALAFPLVVLAFLAGITPAGLGLAEWSWVALLSVQGVDPETAAQFALGSRLLFFAATFLLAAVCLMNLRRWWRAQEAPSVPIKER